MTVTGDAPIYERNLQRQIRGDDIGRALTALPVCAKDSPATITNVIEVDGIGRVKFTFSRLEQRRFGRRFWVCDRAERTE